MFDPRMFEKALAKRNEEAKASLEQFQADLTAGKLDPLEPNFNQGGLDLAPKALESKQGAGQALLSTASLCLGGLCGVQVVVGGASGARQGYGACWGVGATLCSNDEQLVRHKWGMLCVCLWVMLGGGGHPVFY